MRNDKLIEILMTFPLDMDIPCSPSILGDRVYLSGDKEFISIKFNKYNQLKELYIKLLAELYGIAIDKDVSESDKKKIMKIFYKYYKKEGSV